MLYWHHYILFTWHIVTITYCLHYILSVNTIYPFNCVAYCEYWKQKLAFFCGKLGLEQSSPNIILVRSESIYLYLFVHIVQDLCFLNVVRLSIDDMKALHFRYVKRRIEHLQSCCRWNLHYKPNGIDTILPQSETVLLQSETVLVQSETALLQGETVLLTIWNRCNATAIILHETLKSMESKDKSH